MKCISIGHFACHMAAFLLVFVVIIGFYEIVSPGGFFEKLTIFSLYDGFCVHSNPDGGISNRTCAMFDTSN